MPPAKLGAAVREIVKVYRKTMAEREFSAEDAEQIWGGTKAAKVSDLTDTQLLQLALLMATWDVTTLRRTLEEAVAVNQKLSTNRAQRRATDKRR